MGDSLRSGPFAKTGEVLLIAVGLAGGRLFYFLLFPENFELLTVGELVGGFLLSLMAFWISLTLIKSATFSRASLRLFRLFCAGIGLSLIFHAFFNYFQLMTRSFFLVLVGGALATLTLGIGWRWIYVPQSQTGILMVGFTSTMEQLARALEMPILGVIAAPAKKLSQGIQTLGEMDQFEEIVRSLKPTLILIGTANWASYISPSRLLKLQFEGVTVWHAPTAYEQILERVYCLSREPAEMLLSPAFCVDSRTMALQAIYTNLIGILFLAVLSPVLVVVSFAIIVSGNGSAFENVDCLGFEKIPFRLLRFRIRHRDGSGDLSWVGKIISRLQLVDLPQLINVVRGEMALVGPRPVRREFAERLSQIMPFYSIRCFVKPGIFGQDSRRTGARAGITSELRRVEADLYYIKRASPLLDFEILLRALPARVWAKLPVEELASDLQ